MNDRDQRQSPFVAGIRCRCPRCAKGRLFEGYLKPVDRCDSCGIDLTFADSADGPAIFIIFIVGFLVMAMAMIVQAAYPLSPVQQLAIWLPATIVLCMALLRPFKGMMIALHYANYARGDHPD